VKLFIQGVHMVCRCCFSRCSWWSACAVN